MARDSRDDEEVVVVVGEDYPYCSDSDSDDDVDRYVFLARQPAPVDNNRDNADEEEEVPDRSGCHKRKRSDGSQADEEHEASSESDEDDDSMPGGDQAGGGRGIRKTMGAQRHAPLSRKKARFVDVRSPLNLPSGVGRNKIGSDEEAAAHAKSKKRRGFVDGGEEETPVRGKRSRGCPDSEPGSQPAAVEEEEERAPNKRFACSICGRGFGSYQALGGHVLGHKKKKAKNAAIAVAARDATTTATVAVAPPVSQGQNFFFTDAYGQGERGSDDDGSFVEKNLVIVDDIAANHDAAVNESCGHSKAETASAIDAAADADHKVGVVGSSHNGDSDVIMQYRCEVCGKGCLTGQALGGHMGKHRRTRLANGGEGEVKPPRSAPVASGGS
uniref:C2H2-type domain-containing protein n=1 Tax=Leersia perrieri TaxID=77586 RepID=A0A0D9VXT4_9ORYZ